MSNILGVATFVPSADRWNIGITSMIKIRSVPSRTQIKSSTTSSARMNASFKPNAKQWIVRRTLLSNAMIYRLTNTLRKACIRKILAPRFSCLDLTITRLPTTAGPTDPHIPILTSPNLDKAKRLLIYFGESSQDLGIFAYRVVGQESIAAGSALNFVSDALKDDLGKDTAVVIANLGQLVWWRRGKKAITITSWNALPRKNGVGGGMRMDSVKNRVQGHENFGEHVRRVFEFIDEKAKANAKIDIIGLSEGAEEAVKYLDGNWEIWKERVRAVCVGLSYVWEVKDEVHDPAFKDFWAKVRMSFLS